MWLKTIWLKTIWLNTIWPKTIRLVTDKPLSKNRGSIAAR